MKSITGKLIRFTLPVFFSASLFLVSCNKDEITVGPDSSSNNNGSNSGSGSTYLTFKVNGVPMDLSSRNPNGFYDASSDGTYIYGRPSGSGFTYPELDLGFSGKTPGTYTQTNGGWVDFTDANNMNYYYEPSTCTITVTQYGAIGGYIVGTFSASKNSSTSTATITEGKFSVKRTY